METARALRPHRILHGNWRVGKLLAINGASASVRVLVSGAFRRTKTVATSILPAGIAVGHPLAVEISSSHPDDSTIVRVVPGLWGGNEPQDETTAATDDGRFGVLPRSITNEPRYWNW